MWNLTSPVLLLVGDEDVVWPADLVAEARRRFEQWGIDHTINVYPGAGHAFCAPAPAFHNGEASAAAWRDSLEFLQQRT